jgi:hypothetical protein
MTAAEKRVVGGCPLDFKFQYGPPSSGLNLDQRRNKGGNVEQFQAGVETVLLRLHAKQKPELAFVLLTSLETPAHTFPVWTSGRIWSSWPCTLEKCQIPRRISPLCCTRVQQVTFYHRKKIGELQKLLGTEEPSKWYADAG